MSAHANMPNMNVNLDELIRLRHWLHMHPEVSRHETKTAKHVREYLEKHATPDEIIFLAGAGFAAVYNGKEPGKTVLIRAELDALPIHEINDDIPYRSKFDGVGHKCGHDGHMTILAGLAQIYAKERPQSGRIVLLYQPDEETGTGARECSRHPNFQKIKPDFAFSLHNFPDFPKHQILCKTGTFTSSVRFMAIRLTGKESHSAMPETGANPSLAIAEITLLSQEVQAQFDTPEEYALVVPIHFQMGISSSGVSPGYGEAHYTIRSCRDETVDKIWDTFSKKAQEIAERHKLKIELEVLEDFAANFNDAEVVEMVEKAAKENGFNYTQLEKPFRGGEDFGEILKQHKGAMFGLGAGENRPNLHNPDYDFPDEIITTGIKMFKHMIEQALASNEGTLTKAA
ncbi:MAG: amidohydrolase [Proteobacteria bacterium]|nr:amidohydrolase [Pseudomonadota bacterium]